MHETYCEYRNARTIEYNRWSEHAAVNELAQELVADIKSRKRDGYIFNMKVLLLDLFHSFLTDPTQYVSYYRDNNHYDFKKRYQDGDRYVDNPHITRDYLVGSVKVLLAGEYITNKPGQNFYNEFEGVHGFLSKMRATPKLIELWRKYGWKADMIGQWKPDGEVEVIILKAKTVRKQIEWTYTEKVDGIAIKKTRKKTIKIKKECKYSDTAVTKRMRGIVHAYNRLLDNTHIDCDAACISEKDKKAIIEKLDAYGDGKEQAIRLRLGSKHVYRVFSGGDKTFTLGGRYYGAWWIGCPSELRKYITLDGKPTLELDYKGIHIHLLYALKGINYADKGDDPYNLICKAPDEDPDRDLNKLILLTAINAENETKARDSVFDQLRKDKELTKYGLTTKEPITKKLKQLQEKHAPIAEYIASGAGLKLQYYDSCIIEKLIDYAIRSNYPILTVHDSVICEADKAILIREKMLEYFKDLVKEKLGLSLRLIPDSPHAKHVFMSNAAQSQYTSPPINMLKELPELMRPSRAAMETYLKPDKLIKIKPATRDNTCSGECNHSKRLRVFGAHRRKFLGSIIVALAASAGSTTLFIRD